MVGLGVTLIFLAWLTADFLDRQQMASVELLEEYSSSNSQSQGVADEIEDPGVEEFAEVETAQLKETVEAVTDILSSQEAAIRALDGSAALQGTGKGEGDHRLAGPGGDGDTIPRWDRWELRFEPSNMTAYTKQLDYFGIELAANSRQATLYYASQFSTTKQLRTVESPTEERLRFIWKDGELRNADRQLLRQAGVPLFTGQILMQFYPKNTENLLALAENEHSGGRPVSEIRKTVFGVEETSSGYRFIVLEQLYR